VNTQRGFTLIEVVVALAIVGLTAVVLFESLRFGQRAHEKVVVRGGDTWQVFAAQRLIRSLIESAYPREPASTESVPVYGLGGDQSRMSVLAAAPLALGGAGLQRYDIEPRRNARGSYDVIVRWRADPSPDSSLLDAALAEEILIEDAQSIRWSYLDAEHEGQAGWVDDWHDRQRLPRLVRLQVTFSKNDPRTWPALVMAPRLTDDANCRFDIIAQRCRSGS
jgi:general secretion pathway protein J